MNKYLLFQSIVATITVSRLTPNELQLLGRPTNQEAYIFVLIHPKNPEPGRSPVSPVSTITLSSTLSPAPSPARRVEIVEPTVELREEDSPPIRIEEEGIYVSRPPDEHGRGMPSQAQSVVSQSMNSRRGQTYCQQQQETSYSPDEFLEIFDEKLFEEFEQEFKVAELSQLQDEDPYSQTIHQTSDGRDNGASPNKKRRYRE
ncbi:hypothetical protein QAD02_016541 [Eretmocerus hayati]|uniref:Uncharacterized protein n=1 Tax=Eretmocerus hayati TaxID=131215 RepID=A0ACC2PAY6_9HYME|nr:hypothetical protein QAD02_016541 [Eretmocerus hayati]